MNIVGIDPGRDKCGVAVLNSSAEILFEKVIETSEFETILKNLVEQYNPQLVILGDGTTHKNAEKILRSLNLEVKVVDEKHTTEEARKLYWKKNPPHGWRRILPTSMQVPPEPVDGIVAEILVKRHLKI
jgi:RNase H-fold protein (predicted Holliday junction resolvase)